MEFKDEIWKDIKDYKGLYQVSNLGRVKSLKRSSSNNCVKDKILKYSFNKKGYQQVNLFQKNKQKCFKIHRLVAKQFIPNLENKPQVNHINGIKTDNRVENLEWVTCLENTRHAIRKGLIDLEKRKTNMSNVGKLSYPSNNKKVYQYDLNNNFIKEWNSHKEACNELNIKNPSTISECLKGNSKSAGGYVWKNVLN